MCVISTALITNLIKLGVRKKEPSTLQNSPPDRTYVLHFRLLGSSCMCSRTTTDLHQLLAKPAVSSIVPSLQVQPGAYGVADRGSGLPRGRRKPN